MATMIPGDIEEFGTEGKGFVAKRAGKPYEGKPHVRFEVAGDGEVLWRA
jgi:hypothetical protein